ncbi:MAG: TonB-dependent receptor [Chitinophagales bacterium]
MKLFTPILVFFSFVFTLQGQDCKHTIKGQIVDIRSGEYLDYANIYVEEITSGTTSDSVGKFTLKNLCAGEYHLRISHIGCETEELFITIVRDTFLNVKMHHHPELLDELTIHGTKEDVSAQTSNTINSDAIINQSNKNLSDLLANIQGVSVLKTGSNVSKPIVHGLYGNRVAILNNGIVQSGQQWGNDHAPEIDPFLADHISVVKGASALAYSGNSLGSIVLVESKRIDEDPHLHGLVNYRLQSKGVGHTLNTKIEKYSKWAAWRISGTIKFFGDQRTSDYYLTNTGKREYNISAKLEKKINEKWQLESYYSLFTTEIGILRGSHISNLTDLKEAFNREEPFLTEDNFSYKIDAPRQSVMHHLVKLESKYQLNDDQIFNFKYGLQINQRKEFDIRRLDRSDIPALSLLQQNHVAEALYSGSFNHDIHIQSGVQFDFTDNTNSPETGILPLIPDYRQTNSSLFFIFHQDHPRVFYEWGARYNLQTLEAITISKTPPRVIERFNHLFHNYAFSAGIKIKANEKYKINLETGYTLRSPQVNELYSAGLHQGVSGIEEGNGNLSTEKSFKMVFANNVDVNNKVFIQALGYYQNIHDYIYLKLEDELRLTIRGAFPLFTYQQTNVNLYGTDLLASFEATKQLKMVFKYALVRGRDINQKIALINLPSDYIDANIAYTFKDGGKMKHNTIGLNGSYTFKQKNIQAEVIKTEEDEIIIDVPSGYFLLGFNASTELELKKSVVRFSLTIDNMLNTDYRNYLNRQRYFADDLGIDVGFSVMYKF